MISTRRSISLQLKTTVNKIQLKQEKQTLKQTLCEYSYLSFEENDVQIYKWSAYVKQKNKSHSVI